MMYFDDDGEWTRNPNDSETSFISNTDETSFHFNPVIGSPVEVAENRSATKATPEPKPSVLRFDQDIAAKTYGGPNLLDSLINQFRRYNLEELDEMTHAFELLRTRVITGWFRSDLVNVSDKFNWTGLNILSNSLIGFPPQDQLLHINHNLNMIRAVVEERVSNGSRPQPPPPLEVVPSEHSQPEEEEMTKNLASMSGIKSSSPVKSVWMSPLPESIYTSERSV